MDFLEMLNKLSDKELTELTAAIHKERDHRREERDQCFKWKVDDIKTAISALLKIFPRSSLYNSRLEQEIKLSDLVDKELSTKWEFVYDYDERYER